MIKIAICDDEIEITNQVEDLLALVENTYQYECEVYYSGEGLYRAIEQGARYDLIYLDIELGGVDGITIARKFREIDKNSVLIYITSHTSYAIEAFEVETFRFLTKPFNSEKFAEYYHKAMKKIIQEPEYYRYGFKGEHFNILIQDIQYFESRMRTIQIHMKSGSIQKFYHTLDKVEQELKNSNIPFYRITQSLLVNSDAV